MSSPLMVQMCMHYTTLAGAYAANDGQHANSSAVLELHDYFVNNGFLIKLDEPNSFGARYTATEDLYLWKAAICAVPMPSRQWVQPNASKERLGDEHRAA